MADQARKMVLSAIIFGINGLRGMIWVGSAQNIESRDFIGKILRMKDLLELGTGSALESVAAAQNIGLVGLMPSGYSILNEQYCYGIAWQVSGMKSSAKN